MQNTDKVGLLRNLKIELDNSVQEILSEIEEILELKVDNIIENIGERIDENTDYVAVDAVTAELIAEQRRLERELNS